MLNLNEETWQCEAIVVTLPANTGEKVFRSYPLNMLTNIDNVVFDLGGVVIDLDRERCIRSFEKSGISDAGELLGQYRQEGPFLDLETGRITAAEFFDILRRKACPGTTDEELQNAFNSFLVDLPVRRLQAIRMLRSGRRVFALSNTNPVMYNSWIASAFRAEGLTVNDYFEGVVASFAEGCCKPDRRIFEILISRYGLEPGRTLFLDDSEANCRAAESTGLKSLCVTPGSDFITLLNL